jgi:hypothetical protein
MMASTRSTTLTSISKKDIVQGGQKRDVWIRHDHTYVTILRPQKDLPAPSDARWDIAMAISQSLGWSSKVRSNSL